MKKLLSVMLSVLLIFSVCTVAFAEAEPELQISAEDTFASRGESVEVKVNLDKNAGLKNLLVRIGYDQDVLEIACPDHKDGEACTPGVVKASLSDKFSDYGATSQYHTKNPYVATWAYGTSTEAIDYTGTLLTFTFNVKSDAPLGKSEITVIIDEVNTDKFLTATEVTKFSGVEAINGSVTVKDSQAKPEAPTLEEVTETSVTLTAIDGYEYKVDDGAWQDSNVFKGLTLNTTYSFYQRVKESDTTNASEESSPLSVTTNDHSYTETVISGATCTEPGTKFVTCSGCDISYEETIPATGHTAGDWIVETDAMGVTTGYKYKVCEVCGEEVARVDTTEAELVLSAESKVVARGDVIEYNVSLLKNPGLINLAFKLAYDSDVLEPICTTHDDDWCDFATKVSLADDGVYGNDIGAISETHDVNPFVMMWCYGTTKKAITYTGTVATFKFKVKETAPLGTSLVDLIIDELNSNKFISTTDTPYFDTVKDEDGTVTVKDAPAKPDAPTLANKTDTTVTLTAISGYEYKMDNGDWQDTNTFTGLLPNSTHSFCQRVKESDISFVSETSDALTVTTDKSSVTAPSVPTVKSQTCDTVTLVATAGYEYKVSGGEWQNGNAFAGLSADTVYTFYQRVAETDTTYASPSSSALSVTTDSHNLEESVITYADCTNPGSKKVTCSNCDFETEETIDPLGHSYGDWVVDKETSATEPGAQHKTCSRCGDTVEEEIPVSDLYVAGENLTVSRGQTFTYSIDLKANDGLQNFAFEFAYDTDVLEIVCLEHEEGNYCVPDVTKVSLASGAAYGSELGTISEFHTTNPFVMMWCYGTTKKAITYTGTVATINFRVKDNAPLGKSVIDITIDENNCDKFLTSESNEKFTSPAALDGSVTVKEVAATPEAPTVKSKTDTTVTLTYVEGYEYKVDGGEWQESYMFSGFEPNTTHNFYQRAMESEEFFASDSSTALSVTTNKSTVEAPDVPSVKDYTDTTVTLTAISGYEYKMDNGNWQTSNVFTGLAPNSTHSFYQRVAETDTTYASDSSDFITVTTFKSTVAKPVAPSVAEKTDSSITLVATAGYEYKMDNGNWQTGNVFTGLAPNSTHNFYQRVAETDTTYASDSSDVSAITTLKSTVAKPSAAPVMEAKTDTTVTLVAVSGYEYKVDNGDWQTSNIFTGLAPNSTHNFYQRVAETDTTYASDSSDALSVTTYKSTVPKPAAPTVQTKTDTTVILVAAEGYLYKMGDGEWQTSNIFEGLTHTTAYTFYQKVAETDTTYESESSDALSVTTNPPFTPGDINGDGFVNLNDVSALAQYVAKWNSVVYLEAALDCNGDGLVNLNDVSILAQYIAKWNVTLSTVAYIKP